MYYVDNNQDYRDPHHPHTFVFLNPEMMQPQLMNPQMNPLMNPQMMQPQMMPQLAPQAPSLPNITSSPIGVPGAFINPPNPSGAQLLPMADQVAGLTGGPGGFGGAGFGGAGGFGGSATGVTEESYIENILRFNRGKIATVYMTFENNNQWNARVFRGRVETAGRDHIILSDPQTGKRYILLMINLDWVEFDEPLAYIPPSIPAGIQLTTGGGGAPAAGGSAVGTGPGTTGNSVVGAGPGTAGSRDEA